MWLSKRSSDGKSTDVAHHRPPPGQQQQHDEAITTELLQVLAADAVRRLSQEEELNLKHERFVAHAVGSYVEVHRRRRQKGRSAVGHFGISAPRTYKCTDRSLKLRVHFGDVSSVLCLKSVEG